MALKRYQPSITHLIYIWKCMTFHQPRRYLQFFQPIFPKQGRLYTNAPMTNKLESVRAITRASRYIWSSVTFPHHTNSWQNALKLLKRHVTQQRFFGEYHYFVVPVLRCFSSACGLLCAYNPPITWSLKTKQVQPSLQHASKSFWRSVKTSVHFSKNPPI